MQTSNLMPKNNRATWFRDLVLITLLLSGFFAFMLGTRPLNVPDEARYSEIPREMIISGDYITPHLDNVKYFEKPPLFYWMQVGAIKAFGLNNWSYRCANALMALLGCLIIYTGTRILFDRKTAWFSCTILATSLLYFIFAHAITLDMTLSTFMTGTLLSFIVATRYPPGKIRRTLFLCTYAFAALATMTKSLVGVLLPGAIIFSWLLIFNEWRQLKSAYYVTGILLFLLIVLPWHIVVQIKNPEFFHFYFIDQQFTRYLTNAADRIAPDWFFIPILFFGLFPWVVFLFQAIKFHFPQHWRDRFQQKEAIFLMLWATIIFVFFSLSRSKLIPYILPTVPPLAILIGHYLASSENRPGIKRGFMILPALTILISIGLFVAEYYISITNTVLADKITWLIIVVIIFGSALSYWVYLKKGTTAAFYNQLASTVILMLSLMVLMPLLDMGSILPLYRVLQPMLKPDDQVVCYHYYYQDLPLYLQRRVTIVQWTNELEFGMHHQDTGDWMWDNATLWQHWKSPQTFYMITTEKLYHSQLLYLPVTIRVLGTTEHDVLLTNH